MKILVACFAGLCMAMVTKATSTAAATNSSTAMSTNTSTPTTKFTTMTTMATTSMPPKPNKYQVKDSNGTVCVEMDAVLVLFVVYDIAGGNKTATGNLTIPPSESTTNVTGKCFTNGSDPEIILSFDNTNIAKFVFHNDNGTASISHIDFKIRLDKVHFPNAARQGKFVMDDEDVMFKLGTGTFHQYYQCKATESVKGQNVTIQFSILKVQAYGMAGKFSDNGFECDQDNKTTAMTSVSTTTGQASTATTPVMTTTPKPTPGTPTVNNFTVEGDGIYCIVMDVGLQIKIQYNDTKGAKKTATVNIPSGVAASGSCMNETDTLIINFFTTWMLEMDFVMVHSAENDDMFSLENITLHYNISELVDVKDAQTGQSGTIMAINKSFFKSKAGADGGYKCSAMTTIIFDGSKENMLITSDMKLQAFRTTNSTHIDNDKDLTVCPKDEETNNIVPIAVGAALAALVVIVLIAYLIGRKRSHKGYESV